MTNQRISDPQQWNLYAYVRNNPLAFIDPDGKELRPVRVYLTGNVQGIRYIDTRLVPRLERFVQAARESGLTFTFNELFRTQSQQAGIRTSFTKNTRGTSPHAAGVAFDVNVSTSLTPGGLKSLPALTTAAGSEGANFSPLANQAADLPHFQANDLITRGSDGKPDQAYMDLIQENQASFVELEKLRKENPPEFQKRVIGIDSYTRAKQKPKKEEEREQ
jgi:uncharacterized protein RhaS with RHS repeats